MTDPADAHTRDLAAAHDDPTAWSEQLYREAADDAVTVPERLYHVVEREVWEQAVRDGAYVWSTRGVTVQDEGFVHLSRADQVAGTLALFYAEVAGDLLLLVVDPTRTGAEIKLEDGFFHTYGELPIAAVVEVLPIGRADGGAWVSPV